MADPSKFKSIGIDLDTYNKLKIICDKERRNIRQQIGLMVDKEYEKQDKDMRLLSYKILVEKFNKKYGNLTTPQRNLLKHFINNISNTNSLREYIESEVTKLKSIK